MPTQVAHENGAVRPGIKGRTGARSLTVFVAVSVMAHALVFGILPLLERDQDPPPIVLDVTLVEPPKPLPVAPPEPEPLPPPPKRKPEPQRAREPAPTKAPPDPRPVEQPQVLALPATQAPAESTFTVPAPPAEAPRGAEQKGQAVGAGVTPPAFNAAYLRNPAPNYPLAARRAGQQGTTIVRVRVTPEGLPDGVHLEKSSGSAHLDHAAVEAVKGWRFTPARRGSEAVEGWVLVPIVFRLEG